MRVLEPTNINGTVTGVKRATASASGASQRNDSVSGYGSSRGGALGRGAQFQGGAASVRLVPSTASTHDHGQGGRRLLDKSARIWFCTRASSGSAAATGASWPSSESDKAPGSRACARPRRRARCRRSTPADRPRTQEVRLARPHWRTVRTVREPAAFDVSAQGPIGSWWLTRTASWPEAWSRASCMAASIRSAIS